MRSISIFGSLALLLSLVVSAGMGQLPAVVDPLYTNPIADPLAIPQFVNPLPAVPRLDYTAGATINMTMGTGSHDFGIGAGATTVWGYNLDGGTIGYLGPTIVAMKDNPVTVNWTNALGFAHPMPVDMTLHWAFAHVSGAAISTNGVPAVPHLHGGNTESASDGLPEAWWTPTGDTGPHFVKTNYFYENNQEAATLWYHDHGLGITRLNVYMGLAAFYLLRDNNEMGMINNNQLPSGIYEREIVLQDKTFYPDGSLAYPDVAAPAVAGFDVPPNAPSVQPEFFGEVIVVNGKAWPFLNVEPRKYRFRLLNGSDSRFYELFLGKGAQFVVIGNDDGFLNAPVAVNTLTIGPGERYDVVVDFAKYRGKTLVMRNSARSPYPKGATVDPRTTGQIIAFNVSPTPVADPVTLPTSLRPVPIAPLVADAPARDLILFEGMDHFGRLQPMLGTVADGTLLWDAPITENPALGSTEVWNVYNATADAHPIHIHLVKYQILGRQKFTAAVAAKTMVAHDGSNSTGGILSGIKLKGMRKGPGADESGWKDTAIMYPGEVTSVITTFMRPGRYVWHCHILSHEDHEMMRPYEVVGVAKSGAGAVAANTTEGLPREFSLSQNYPNPFNPETTIEFALPQDVSVRLTLYNSLGQEMQTLINEVLPAGSHTVKVDAKNLASGVYYYRIAAGTYTATKSMVLVR